MDKMFCYQCQETAKNEGCKVMGVCGKTADVANLQDLLIFMCKGLSHYTLPLRKFGIELPEVNRFIVDSLFMTITNANFDRKRFVTRVRLAYELREAAKEQLLKAGLTILLSMVLCGRDRPKKRWTQKPYRWECLPRKTSMCVRYGSLRYMDSKVWRHTWNTPIIWATKTMPYMLLCRRLW